MKATVNRKEILALMSKVKQATASRSTLPICQEILLKAQKGKLTATGTDLEVALIGTCSAKVDKPGSICIPPKPLMSFLQAVGTEEVSLSLKGKQIELKANSASIAIDGELPEDFPPIADVKGKKVVLTNLATALKQVDHAMATKHTRQVLTGICFTQKNGEMELVGADGFRLAITQVKSKGKLSEQTIVPSRAVNLLMKLFPGDVTLRQNGQNLLFESEGIALATNATQGTSPDYSQVIPPKHEYELRVEVAEMKKVLKVVMSAQSTSGITRLVANGNGKGLTISSESVDGATTKGTMPAKGKIKTALNEKYLKDVLDRSEGEIVIESNTPNSSIVLRHAETLHVVMPMFVQW